MNFDVMRRKLLEQAVRGQLVPQLDGEPEVERVGKEPADVPFEIPRKWKWCTLGSITTYGGRNQVAPDKIPNNSWILDLEDIEKNTGHLLTKKRGIPFSSNKTAFKKGDVLYGKLRPYLNKVIIADEDGFCTTEIISIPERSFLIPLLPEYLKFYLMSPCFVEYADRCSYGVKMPRLGTKDAKAAAIPIPPIQEQNRIVSKLKNILEIIDKAEKAYSELTGPLSNRFRSLCLERAIKGELLPQLESESPVEPIGGTPEDIPFSIPDRWKWTRIQDVATLNPKITTHDESLKVSFAPMASVDAGYINRINTSDERSWSSVKTGYAKFAEDDILLAKITPCFQNRKSAIATNLKNGIGCGSTEFHVLRASKEVDKEYLLMFLKSQWFIEYGVENFKGTAGQQRLGTADLKSCPFPLPPLKEQRRIVEKLNVLFKDLDRLTG